MYTTHVFLGILHSHLILIPNNPPHCGSTSFVLSFVCTHVTHSISTTKDHWLGLVPYMCSIKRCIPLVVHHFEPAFIHFTDGDPFAIYPFLLISSIASVGVETGAVNHAILVVTLTFELKHVFVGSNFFNEEASNRCLVSIHGRTNKDHHHPSPSFNSTLFKSQSWVVALPQHLPPTLDCSFPYSLDLVVWSLYDPHSCSSPKNSIYP